MLRQAWASASADLGKGSSRDAPLTLHEGRDTCAGWRKGVCAAAWPLCWKVNQQPGSVRRPAIRTSEGCSRSEIASQEATLDRLRQNWGRGAERAVLHASRPTPDSARAQTYRHWATSDCHLSIPTGAKLADCLVHTSRRLTWSRCVWQPVVPQFSQLEAHVTPLLSA